MKSNLEVINEYCEVNGLIFNEWLDSKRISGEESVTYYSKFNYKNKRYKNKKIQYGFPLMPSKENVNATINSSMMDLGKERDDLLYPILEVGRKELIDKIIATV